MSKRRKKQEKAQKLVQASGVPGELKQKVVPAEDQPQIPEQESLPEKSGNSISLDVDDIKPDTPQQQEHPDPEQEKENLPKQADQKEDQPEAKISVQSEEPAQEPSETVVIEETETAEPEKTEEPEEEVLLPERIYRFRVQTETPLPRMNVVEWEETMREEEARAMQEQLKEALMAKQNQEVPAFETTLDIPGSVSNSAQEPVQEGEFQEKAPEPDALKKPVSRPKRDWKPFVHMMVRNPGFWICLAMVLVLLVLCGTMIATDLFKLSLAGLLLGIGLISAAAAGYAFYCTSGWRWKVPAVLLAVLVVLAGTGFGRVFEEISAAMSVISQPSQDLSGTVNLYVYSQAPAASLEALNGQTVGIIKNRQSALSQAMLDDLSSQNINVKVRQYDSLQQLYKALKGQAVVAAVMSPSDIRLVQEFSSLEKAGRDLKLLYSLKVNDIRQVVSNPVNSSSDPYTVLLSASKEPLNQNNYRSTLNVLLCVNPRSSQVLAVVIPRSLWTSYSCEEYGCPADMKDKLAYSSTYSLAALEKNVENLLSVNVDFTMRIDLDQFMNLCDSIGPIPVDSADLFADKLGQAQTLLNMPKARQFLGTLNDFSSSDLNQEENQLRLLSDSADYIRRNGLTKLKPMLSALKNSVRTNMSYAQLADFVKEFFLLPGPRQDSLYVIKGTDGIEYSTALTDSAYALYPSADSLSRASQAIQALMSGQDPKEILSTPEQIPAAPVPEQPAAEPEENPEEAAQEQPEEPAAEEPVWQEPVWQPVYEQPVYEEPVQDPAVDEPVYDPGSVENPQEIVPEDQTYSDSGEELSYTEEY